LDKLYNK